MKSFTLFALLLSCWTATFTAEIDWTSGDDCKIIGLANPPQTPQCAKVQLYKDWEAQSFLDLVTINVQKLPANPQSRKGQVWVLGGGPGLAVSHGRAAEFLARSKLYNVLNGEYDFIFIDYRGVGDSEPNLGGTAENCVQELDGYQFLDAKTCAALRPADSHLYTVTNMAKDVEQLILKHAAPPEEHTVILGVGWGTYLLQRLMQIDNASDRELPLAKQFIFDSPCVSGQCMALASGLDPDLAGKYYLSHHCALDKACRSFMGNDPLTDAKNTFILMDENRLQCAEDNEIDRITLSSILGDWLLNFYSSPLVPAFLHRLRRCSSTVHKGAGPNAKADTEVIKTVAANYREKRKDENVFGSTAGDSLVLRLNIEYSEMWMGSDVPTPEELTKTFEDYMFGRAMSPLSPVFMVEGYEDYPIYPPDEFMGKFPSTHDDSEVLILSGGLDALTPRVNGLWLEAELAASGADVRHIHMFNAGHFTLATSGVRGGGTSCAGQITRDFIQNYNVAENLPLHCLSEMLRPDFSVQDDRTKDVAHLWFGTEDIWGAAVPDEEGTGNDKDKDQGGSGMSTGAVIAIVIVAIVATGMITAASCWYYHAHKTVPYSQKFEQDDYLLDDGGNTAYNPPVSTPSV